MILGLDVGGTQTDAVLIDEGQIVAATKTPTGKDLLATLRNALDNTLVDVEPASLDRMAFSTTMGNQRHRAGPTGRHRDDRIGRAWNGSGMVLCWTILSRG